MKIWIVKECKESEENKENSKKNRSFRISKSQRNFVRKSSKFKNNFNLYLEVEIFD